MACSQASRASGKSNLASNNTRALFALKARKARLAGQSANSGGQTISIPLAHHKARLALLDRSGYFAFGVSHKNDGPASGCNAVIFTGDDQALEFRPQGDEMHVRQRQAFGQKLLGLIGFEQDALEIALLHLAFKRFHLRPPADKEPANLPLPIVTDAPLPRNRPFQSRHRRKKSVHAVRAPEIARITNYECILKPPFLCKDVVLARHRTDKAPACPIWDDPDLLFWNTQAISRNAIWSPMAMLSRAFLKLASRKWRKKETSVFCTKPVPMPRASATSGKRS